MSYSVLCIILRIIFKCHDKTMLETINIVLEWFQSMNYSPCMFQICFHDCKNMNRT
uniref:Uncharacterized protein n=1 Tax=Anguilla anguilla TaxID=7936 RepID=A0A0E9X0P4_ANGAN